MDKPATPCDEALPARPGIKLLPVELTDLIFRNAIEDQTSISTCTLVSRSWRQVALPHLFSSLSITRQARFDALDGFLTSHPHIARCVRKLEVRHLPGDVGAPTSGSHTSAITYGCIASITTKLPELQELHLQGIWFADTATMADQLYPADLAVSTRLKTLTLQQCANGGNRPITLQTLHAILAIFPADTVSLYVLTVAHNPSYDPTASIVPSHWGQWRVHTLTLYRNNTQRWPTYDLVQLYDMLRRVIAHRCLRTLRTQYGIARQRLESLRAFGEFLDHAGGETLRTLELPFTIAQSVYPSEDDPDYWRVLRLNTCCDLESLTLWVYIPRLRYLATIRHTLAPITHSDVPPSAVCIAILANVSPTLRTLTLALFQASGPVCIQSEKLSLGLIDDALSEQRFPSLTKVKIVLYDSVSMEESSEAVREMMPKCRQRGLLDFTAGSNSLELDSYDTV
ncbi:hypothetical protein ONZ51_g5242 [Trametes cubensis]|uniref:F-box domain-containing protein n=1 Tax=Trametes cubensis TaxID=1111947 RepID=A0AAD7XBQ0_9APHY|nr:hypothetical protein ONZ51_g5242 [Trametes cubensis]